MTNVPDMSIAPSMGALGNPAFMGSSYAPPGFVAVAPPPAQPNPGTRTQSKRVLGLMPAQVGALFALIVRDAPREHVKPADVSRARAELRRAERDRAVAEATWVNTAAKDPTGQGDRDALAAARDAIDREAMMRRRLGELESAATHKATQVRMARVVDPSEVPDALANPDNPPRYVCMHDGCRHERYDSEQELRRAHPSHSEMQRAQQSHVFALYSDAPLDPLDPDGPTVGYIAPIGRDGSTIERAVMSADANAHDDDRDARIAELEAKLADMHAMIEGLSKKKRGE